jgi:glycosyltransferase involved in cell wall biosynthesis
MPGKVSIITPSFNRAYIIGETAESIFKQTYSNWEWVIVDDGSTDNSWDLIQQYARNDDRVKVYQRDREPKGACVCRNIAVEKCTGDYLIFLDTDDLLAPFCLEQRVSALEEKRDCDFVIFPMLIFKKNTDDLNILWNIETAEDDLSRILKGDPICQGTGTLWKKTSFQKIGMWKEDLMLWQDIELHIRSLLWPVKFAKKMDLIPDVYLRVSDDSLSRVGYFSKSKMLSRISVYTDTCKRLIELNLLGKYKEGIRIMGLDVIKSAINSKLYSAAKSVIALCESNKIFTCAEIRLLRNLLIANKIKLYYLPFLYKKITDNADRIEDKKNGYLSTINYLDNNATQLYFE